MIVLRVLLCAALVAPLSIVAPAGASTIASSAPADEYFGAQKMSAIGIRMRIDALGRSYHARTKSDDDLVHDASLAEASLVAWNRRYPRDPWLAPTTFHLEQLYAAIQSPAARTHAVSLLHVLATTFGATSFGHLSRLRLAQGLPPLHAESEVVSPSPSAAPAAAPATSPVASDAPASAPPTTQPH